jgi:translation initiation factor 4E
MNDEVEDLTTQAQIQNRYTFWYKGGSHNVNKAAVVNYLDSIKKIASFCTVEHFWRIYDHLKRPNDFRVTTEYHLFKEGISPTWEDPQNKLGGKWMLKLKKGIASRYWEDILLAIIGEQFDVGPEICGAVVSVRNNEDIISIWNKTADNTEAVSKIRDQIRRILKLPAIISIEYKRHQDSLTDKSSYRNPTMVWRAPTKVYDNSNKEGAHGGLNAKTGYSFNKGENQPRSGSGSDHVHHATQHHNPNRGERDKSGSDHHGHSGDPARDSQQRRERGERGSSFGDRDGSTVDRDRDTNRFIGNRNNETMPKEAWKPSRPQDSGISPRGPSATAAWSKPKPTSSGATAGGWARGVNVAATVAPTSSSTAGESTSSGGAGGTVTARPAPPSSSASTSSSAASTLLQAIKPVSTPIPVSVPAPATASYLSATSPRAMDHAPPGSPNSRRSYESAEGGGPASKGSEKESVWSRGSKSAT